MAAVQRRAKYRRRERTKRRIVLREAVADDCARCCRALLTVTEGENGMEGAADVLRGDGRVCGGGGRGSRWSVMAAPLNPSALRPTVLEAPSSVIFWGLLCSRRVGKEDLAEKEA